MVGQTGLEPVTPRLSSVCSNQLSYRPFVIAFYRQRLDLCSFEVGGGNRIRTDDIQLAKLALYQLSYTPEIELGQYMEKKELKCALRVFPTHWYYRFGKPCGHCHPTNGARPVCHSTTAR